MIDLTIQPDRRERAIRRARERNIIIPTYRQMKNPALIPDKIKAQLKSVGLWDLNPLNLFRINWHNEPVPSGGSFGGVNYLEFPQALTGVEARIFALVGKWFPTGAHKVGAAFSCLVPRLVTGQFDPTTQKAVWPSTGNYCRGGAYDSALLGCQSIAILPEGMSRERFEWLAKVAGEVIATPGTESNVKEIFDKCWELRRSGQDLMIFNQFEEFGNHLWHYDVTGHAMEEVLQKALRPGEMLRGAVFTTGSAGTIGAGDYLKEIFPYSKLGASEALQCPTLLINGFGSHRIEGIGDKHVPWIHNVRNTDMVVAVDDEAPVQMIRLFNEPEGQKYLAQMGVPEALIRQLPLLGISGAANVLSAIKMAKWYEWSAGDAVITVLTDSNNPWLFRISPHSEMDAQNSVPLFPKMGFNKVTLLLVNTDWGRGSASIFPEVMKKNGITHVMSEFINQDATDFLTQLTKIKNSEADSIYIVTEQAQTALILKQHKQLGLTQKVLTSSGSIPEGLVELAGKESAEGTYMLVYFAPWFPELTKIPQEAKWFVDEYLKRGNSPKGFGECYRGFDGLKAMKAALEIAKTTDKEKVREALAKVDTEGLTGRIKFDEFGQSSPNIYVVQVKDGKPYMPDFYKK